ncbi:MAG: peptidase, partial [Thermotoga sp.]
MNVIKKLVENVPDFHSFMTVDELNESSKKLADTYPDKVKLMEIGKSRDGDPILCLKIGDGDLKALLYAFPHPNEPVGSLMLDYLSWKLVEDDELRKTFNFTWYIVK